MKTICFCFALMVLFSCQLTNKEDTQKTDINAEKVNIETAIKNTIGWALNKDTSLLYNIIAQDENFLEVHPGNRVVKGFKDFKTAESFWLDPRFKAIKSEIWDLRINLSQDGKVAWFYCMLNDITEWDGQPANWENTRWTGVLEKREGHWKMVQQHFSFTSE